MVKQSLIGVKILINYSEPWAAGTSHVFMNSSHEFSVYEPFSGTLDVVNPQQDCTRCVSRMGEASHAHTYVGSARELLPYANSICCYMFSLLPSSSNLSPSAACGSRADTSSTLHANQNPSCLLWRVFDVTFNLLPFFEEPKTVDLLWGRLFRTLRVWRCGGGGGCDRIVQRHIT
jgi:hypothetical protein